jgi:hypothetical protein
MIWRKQLASLQRGRRLVFITSVEAWELLDLLRRINTQQHNIIRTLEELYADMVAPSGIAAPQEIMINEEMKKNQFDHAFILYCPHPKLCAGL